MIVNMNAMPAAVTAARTAGLEVLALDRMVNSLPVNFRPRGTRPRANDPFSRTSGLHERPPLKPSTLFHFSTSFFCVALGARRRWLLQRKRSASPLVPRRPEDNQARGNLARREWQR